MSFDSETGEAPDGFMVAARAYEDAYESASAWTRIGHAWSHLRN